jgi:hypothetical protein
MRKVFDNFWLVTNTTASSQGTPAGFVVSIYGLNRHNSKLPRNSRWISDKFAIYGLHQHNSGLTKRDPEGFQTSVVMVLQPHNSKLPRNSCRIFKQVF